MTVPGRADSAALLLSLDPPPWAIRHARAVGEVAAWLAERIEARGISIDRRAVEAAALLHDVDKLVGPDDPARGLPHGDGSAEWLTRHGHAELGRLVANHPVTRLADTERFRRWSAFATREERIVAYADKRAGQHLQPMSARFDVWRRRYASSPRWDVETQRVVEVRAARLEADVCRAAGVEPSAVRRLRWTDRALATAREARTSRHAPSAPGPGGTTR